MTKPYRSRVGMFKAILECCLRGEKISIICRNCNLSYYEAYEKLELLITAGMVQEIEIDISTSDYGHPAHKKKGKGWKTTEKGLQILQDILKLDQDFDIIGGIFLQ